MTNLGDPYLVLEQQRCNAGPGIIKREAFFFNTEYKEHPVEIQRVEQTLFFSFVIVDFRNCTCS